MEHNSLRGLGNRENAPRFTFIWFGSAHSRPTAPLRIELKRCPCLLRGNACYKLLWVAHHPVNLNWVIYLPSGALAVYLSNPCHVRVEQTM